MFFPIICFAPMEICWAVVICWVFLQRVFSRSQVALGHETF